MTAAPDTAAEQTFPPPGGAALPGRRRLGGIAGPLPTAAVVGAALVLAWREHGSILAGDWASYALFVGLVLVVVLASRFAIRPSRSAAAALVALFGLAAMDAASIAWSPLPTLARDEALLVLLYAVAFAVPVVTLRRPQDRLSAAALVVFGVGGLALTTAVLLLSESAPETRFVEGRLAFPIAYANAQSALYVLVAWPAVAIAARPRAPIALRALALGAGAAALAAAVTGQSKGALIGFVAATIVYFAITPARLRSFVPMLIVLVPVAVAFQSLTAAFRAPLNIATAGAVREAAWAIVAVTCVAVALGAAYAIADRRIAISEPRRRMLGVAVVAAVSLALVGGIAAGLASVHHPVHFAQSKWHDFTTMPSREAASTHLLTLGSARWDAWHVAVHTFADHPVAGVGARGFGLAYAQHGRTTEYLARAHSLPLDVLSETGVIGFALFAAALFFALAPGARRARKAAGSAALLAAAVGFLVHSGVDWIWTFPPVGMLFFTVCGIAAADGAGRPIVRHSGAVALSAGLFLVLAFAPVWLSARLTTQSYRNPSAAPYWLDWARRLDPISTGPLFARAALASSPAAAIAALEEARRMEPQSVAVRYSLGQSYLNAGRIADARRELLVARDLSPRDPIVAAALRRAQRGG